MQSDNNLMLKLFTKNRDGIKDRSEKEKNADKT